ncbi:MAG: hypothetical protein ACOH1V_13160 [Stenotrophomonas sp.]
MFIAAALGLATVAIGDSYLPDAAPLLAPLVHGLAAQTALLCVTCAMLLQTWGFQQDERWRKHHAACAWFAWAAFATLWVHVLWRASPRGLGQKLLIALVVLWLLRVARGLGEMYAPGAAPAPQSGDNAAGTPHTSNVHD